MRDSLLWEVIYLCAMLFVPLDHLFYFKFDYVNLLYSKKVVGILDFEMLVDFMYCTCKYLA